MRIRFCLSIVPLLLCSGLLAQARTTIACLELEATGVSSAEAAALTNRLRSELVSARKYIVLDRENMKAILLEQDFQMTGCTSDECVVQVGQLLGVQNMLSGSVGKFGSTYTITLQIINIETGVLEHSATFDYQGAVDVLLTRGVKTALTRLLGLEVKPEALSAVQTGVLKLDVAPEDAEVLIDGLSYKPDDVKTLEVLAGQHTIEAQRASYYPFHKDVTISRGEELPLEIHLISGAKRLKQYKRQRAGWFLGSVLAGGAAVVTRGMASNVYDNYLAATTIESAGSYRSTVESLDRATLYLVGGSAAALVWAGWKGLRAKSLQKKLGLSK